MLIPNYLVSKQEYGGIASTLYTYCEWRTKKQDFGREVTSAEHGQFCDLDSRYIVQKNYELCLDYRHAFKIWNISNTFCPVL